MARQVVWYICDDFVGRYIRKVVRPDVTVFNTEPRTVIVAEFYLERSDQAFVELERYYFRATVQKLLRKRTESRPYFQYNFAWVYLRNITHRIQAGFMVKPMLTKAFLRLVPGIYHQWFTLQNWYALSQLP